MKTDLNEVRKEVMRRSEGRTFQAKGTTVQRPWGRSVLGELKQQEHLNGWNIVKDESSGKSGQVGARTR